MFAVLEVLSRTLIIQLFNTMIIGNQTITKPYSYFKNYFFFIDLLSSVTVAISLNYCCDD